VRENIGGVHSYEDAIEEAVRKIPDDEMESIVESGSEWEFHHRRFIGAHGRVGGVAMLTRADGWARAQFGEVDGCPWFHIATAKVESVVPAPTSTIPKIMGFKSRAKWEEWCDGLGPDEECCVAIVRMTSGAEFNVFGPAEDVASLIWGKVPSPP
jgi:hypothetical protein